MKKEDRPVSLALLFQKEEHYIWLLPNRFFEFASSRKHGALHCLRRLSHLLTLFLSLQINKVCFDSNGIVDSKILAQASVGGIYCDHDLPINWTLYICVRMTMTSYLIPRYVLWESSFFLIRCLNASCMHWVFIDRVSTST